IYVEATVLLQCKDGQLVANATTNGFGIAYLHSDPMPTFPFIQPENDCKIIVNTTLSNCNSTLPSTGVLESALSLIGTTLVGEFIISSFKPTGFHLFPFF
ncbi:phylloplanin, partial [Phtheirospermum japonicum]